MSEEGRLAGKLWKYVLAQHNLDLSELHPWNKHFKSCLLVVWQSDLVKHEFRLFTRIITLLQCFSDPFIAVIHGSRC